MQISSVLCLIRSLAAVTLVAAALSPEVAFAQYNSSTWGGYNSPAMQQIRRDMITRAINRQTGRTGNGQTRTTGAGQRRQAPQ